MGNGEVDKLLYSIFSITMTEGAYTFFISASNYCVKVTLDDVEVGFVVLHGCVEVVIEIFQFLPERGVVVYTMLMQARRSERMNVM